MRTGFFTVFCMDNITDRSDEHTTYICGKRVGHKSAHEDSVRGCVWTDGEHWGGPERDESLGTKP